MRVWASAILAASLVGCGRPPVQSTLGLELQSAEPFVLHRWSFDPAPHLQTPEAPSPIQASTPHDRFLAVYGRWRIEKDATAPSAPHVLEQDGTNVEPARILVERLGFKSAIVRTSCRVDAPAASCGLVFGARAEDDYYVARVEPANHVVRLVHVVGAVEQELATSSASVDPSRWVQLSVWTRRGDTFVSVDGTVVLSSLAEPQLAATTLGRVGLFAHGPASFDDLAAMEIERPK